MYGYRFDEISLYMVIDEILSFLNMTNCKYKRTGADLTARERRNCVEGAEAFVCCLPYTTKPSFTPVIMLLTQSPAITA